ncbi:MAG: CoA ester lyase, partial [Hyphomicrobiaceae bacterium]
NTVFTPDAKEITRAQRILAAWDAAKAEERGTAYSDGEFIAIDIAIMAERLLAKARQAGSLG